MVNPYLYNQEYNVTLAYVSDLSFAHLDQEYLHFEALLKLCQLLHVASCTSLPS